MTQYSYCYFLYPKRRCNIDTYRVARIFLRFFAIFPAIRKNKFPQIKITTNIFPAIKYKEIVSVQSELVSFIQKQNGIQRNTGLLFEHMYFYCTYSIKTKIFSMLGTGYFLKIAKINFQQGRPICPNRKK